MPGSFDEQVARLDPPLGDVARRFVLVRLTNMRGLDLNLFDVDYDLNWHGIVATPEAAVLARFGGRDADTPGKNHSLAGLRHTLTKVLERFERDNSRLPRTRGRGAGGEGVTPRKVDPLTPTPLPRVRGRGAFEPRRAEEYAAAGRLGSRSCIHCHHVREFQREEKRQAGTWTLADEWVYPEPAALGLTLDIEQGDRIATVRQRSPAAVAGLQPGDVLRTLDQAPVASIMDVQHALHHAPARGKLTMTWQRGGHTHRGVIDLPDDWRQTDVSWRWSLKALPPGPQVSGDDLSDSERRKLGIDPARLALRQNGFVPRAAEQAGLRVNDIVIGIDGRTLDMNARQFEAHVRLHFQVGQTVRYDVLRSGQRLSVPIKLQ